MHIADHKRTIKAAGYKINAQNAGAFIYSNNNIKRNNFLGSPLIIVSEIS